MINLITMAGKGRRFSETGYILPKPLIPVDGVPMVWKVIDSLPKADKWIFIVRQEHIDEFHIDKVIKEKVPDAIICIDKDLLGGASIFCAEQYMPAEEDVFIAGCDNAYVYDRELFEKMKKDRKYDCLLWTFTNDERISKSPQSWGYAVLEEDGNTIRDMSVKVPISDHPEKDHVVTASFYLSSSKILFDAIRRMMKENIKVNNEFYLDMLPVTLKLLGKKSSIFDVDLYVGWGTPAELHTYEKIKHFYSFGKLSELGMSEAEQKLWSDYLENGKDKT